MKNETHPILRYILSLLNNNYFRRAYYSLLVIISLGIFINLCPFNLTTKDAGEYLVSGKFLTIAHPPGAILYSLFLKLFLIFGIKGAYFLNLILECIFSLGAFLIFKEILNSTKKIKDEYIVLIASTLVFFLINNIFFQTAFFLIETDAFIYTLLCISTLFFIKKRYNFSMYIYSISFLINYQLLFLSPVFVLYPLFRKKVKISTFILIFILLFSGFSYLFARTDAVFSWDTGIKGAESFIKYITMAEYQVRSSLAERNFAKFGDFIKYYPVSSRFYLFFLIISPIIAYFSKKSRVILLMIILYSLFFGFVARASALNSLHYAFPLVFFSFLILCYISHVLDEKWVLLAILFLIPDITFFDTTPYQYELPKKYFELATQNIDKGIFLIARDCHINYFRWLLKKDSDLILVNISDLRRSQNREELSLKLGIMLPDRDVPNQINYLISTKMYKIYFENDPIFSFIKAPSAVQGIRKEAFGKYERIITKQDVDTLPENKDILDEEIRNIIVGIKNGYKDQQHFQ